MKKFIVEIFDGDEDYTVDDIAALSQIISLYYCTGEYKGARVKVTDESTGIVYDPNAVKMQTKPNPSLIEVGKMTKEQFEEARRIVKTLDELTYGLEYIERMNVNEIVIKGTYSESDGYVRSDGVKVPYMTYNDETLTDVVDAVKKIINEKIKKFEDRLEKL